MIVRVSILELGNINWSEEHIGVLFFGPVLLILVCFDSPEREDVIITYFI